MVMDLQIGKSIWEEEEEEEERDQLHVPSNPFTFYPLALSNLNDNRMRGT